MFLNLPKPAIHAKRKYATGWGRPNFSAVSNPLPAAELLELEVLIAKLNPISLLIDGRLEDWQAQLKRLREQVYQRRLQREQAKT